MIEFLELKDLGPSSSLRIDFSRRINVITGDNGLGKSFLLEAIWFALTRSVHPGAALLPNTSASTASIRYALHQPSDPDTITFDREGFLWTPPPAARPRVPGIVVYARLDGSIWLFDPLLHRWAGRFGPETQPASFQFNADQIWSGRSDESGKRVLNGLNQDWVSWQKGKEQAFEALAECLAILSPDSSQPIRPGAPKFISPYESTEYPTILMPYRQEVPSPQWPAGMRRIASLAYFLTWAAVNHQKAAALKGLQGGGDILLLVDEVEAHLHPQWQRAILPAINRVFASLLADATWVPQLVCTTHSPLVLASLEPIFDEASDSLFHFALGESGSVELSQLPWSNYGDVSNWLVSPIFELQQARSKEAEVAIEAAEAFMRKEVGSLPARLDTREKIQTELQKTLSQTDIFWPRWITSTISNGQN